MKILVSNPARQHSHRLVTALMKNGFDVVFATSFWYNPNSILWKTLQFVPYFRKQLLKKFFVELPFDFVKSHYTGILFSFIGRFLFSGEKRSFFEDRIQDFWVSRWVKKNKPSVVIGYEKSCLNSFRYSKKYGGFNILDLAATHVNFIEGLRKKYPFYKKSTGNQKLFENIKKIKIEEYELADIIIVLSELARMTLINEGISTSKIQILNIGFDPNVFYQKNVYSKEGTLTLLYVGNITKRKGIHLLTNLINNKDKEVQIRLILVGPKGDALPLLKKENKKIIYYDYLHHADLVEIIHQCDVFVFPSYMDSWGMVVIEAMACGLPVIVTENTGAKDAVNKDCGFVIPIDDVDSLRGKVEYFYNNPTELERMGKTARVQAEKYTWEHYYRQVEILLNEVKTRSSI